MSGGLTRRSLMAIAGVSVLPTMRDVSAAPLSGAARPTIEIAPGSVRLRAEPASETPIVGFGGQIGRVVARLDQGQGHTTRLTNRLDEPVSLFWHGLAGVSAKGSLAASDAIKAGGDAEMLVTPRDPGMVIVRSGTIGRSAEQAERGLAGVVLIDEPEPLPADRDLICLVDDIRLEPDGSLGAFGAIGDVAGPGRLGNLLLVNGRPAPLEEAVPPGGRVRLRLASLCSARLMRLRFDGMRASVIAVDGQPTDTFEPLKAALPFVPGTRYELIVEMPETGGGAVMALIGDGVPIVRLTADPASGARRTDLPPLAPLPANPRLPVEIRLQRAVRADVVIEGGATIGADGRPAYAGDPAAIWRVNGARGRLSASKPIVKAPRGSPVVLALVNRTSWPQPMHLQGHHVRLLHNLDDGWEPYWLDTVTVPSGQTLRIAFVAEQAGSWLFGSTVLERLDNGLFGIVEVA